MWLLSALSRILPLLIVLIILGAIGAFLYGVVRGLSPTRPGRAERKQVREYQALIGRIRHQAFLWRDSDPTLSEFILTEIQNFETRETS